MTPATWIVIGIIVLIVLFAGDPDLLGAFITYLMGGGCES